MQALAARGLAAARARPATPRWRPTSCGPTSAPTTWPTSCCATSAASCAAEADDRRPGHARLRRRRRRRRPQRRDGAGPRGARPRRRRSTSSSRRRGGTALLRDVELPLVDVLAGMERTGIAVDVEALTGAGGRLRRARCARPQARRLRRDRRRADQPRLAQAAAGGALRRPRHAQDQAHQDRLHHRRRRADRPVRQDRAPVPRGAAAAPRRRPAAASPSRACSSRSPTTAASTRPTTRRSRRPAGCRSTDPNLQNIPIRTEEGRRIREVFVVGRGLRVADVGRLQPDRDADHGPPVRRRRA